MTEKHGSLSISSENIFPIIKKWMYSDHDIFYRELISNGCDAITKLKKLEMMGEYEEPEGKKNRITVTVDSKNKTIQILDTGLGMTADEVEEYINQIAFSGATDFLEKYKDKTNEDQIIGHFGLGFYSAFMVADRVTIDTLSYKQGAVPVHWECDGGTDFDMKDGEKTEVGTLVTLYLNEDCLEFCNEYRAREVIQKYCSFMPIEIYLVNAEEERKKAEEAAKKAEEAAKAEDKSEDAPADETKEPEEEKPLNDTNPLWAKHPNECTDEEYKEFYRKVFKDYKEPLFWIHLNMDYPFNLKGILYFPKINMEYESIEGTIKLYNNQVFIADNIKEVIPEFLMLLKGVIDCPDLPLNVSRSALQNDGFVKKISEYITKKVADKLAGMCKTDKENYEKYWDDISPFIKFGCLKDNKFCEKMNDYILFKDIDGKYMTLPECLEVQPVDTEENENSQNDEQSEQKPEVVDADGKPVEEAATDDSDEEEKKEKIIYYVTDEKQQSQYINMFRAAKMTAVLLPDNIDQPFVQQLESKNEGVRFLRIDADVTDTMKSKTSKKELEKLKEKAEDIQKILRKKTKKDKLEVKIEKLKNKKVASVITLSEETRRMQDMMKMYAQPGMDMGMFGQDGGTTLVLNANHPLVQAVMEESDGDHTKMICEQLYDLAMLSHTQLPPEEMTKFIERSNQIMLLLTK